MTRVALVAAVAKGGVIGAKGRLPWRLADDLKWFKEVTLGKPVVMGRKTFDSIGRALLGRDNIVVTRAPLWRAEGVMAARGVAEALVLAEQCARERGAEEICVIGGGEIYAQLLGRADRIYLTRVAADISGDAFFPQIDEAAWRESRAGACQKGPRNAYSCEFVILDRIKCAA